MNIFTNIILGVTFALVLTFQACTPNSLQSKTGTPSVSQSTQNSSVSASNDSGLPFDGKTTTYQNRDLNFCDKVGATQSVRKEIIHDKLGYWLTVNECKTVQARNVEDKTQSDSEKTLIVYKNQILPEVKLKSPTEFTRVRCYHFATGELTAVVYESSDGLTLDYPLFRDAGNPNFIPITATHLLKGGTHSTGFTYETAYHSTFWNEHYQGTFNLYLRSRAPGRTIGNWYMDFKGVRPPKGGAGTCEVETHKYPW